jgi:hypothetical protein
VFSSYSHLVAMLDDGWKIEPPVYVRPRRCSRSKREHTYHFTVWNGKKLTLVSVYDCPELEEFLADNQLVIDRL